MGNNPCTPEKGCDRGQSCIVLRRQNGDPVHEDIVFDKANLPRRTCCTEHFSDAQQAELGKVVQTDGPVTAVDKK